MRKRNLTGKEVYVVLESWSWAKKKTNGLSCYLHTKNLEEARETLTWARFYRQPGQWFDLFISMTEEKCFWCGMNFETGELPS